MPAFLRTLRACAAGVIALALIGAAPSQAAPLTLHYEQPAPDTPQGWEQQALPIGNGRLGAMLFGQPARDRIAFNEITLWTGDGRAMGAYQPFGDVVLTLDGHDRPLADYRRELDIGRAVHRTRYTLDGVRVEREAFASHPAQVIVIHLQADRPGRFTGTVALTDRHDARLAVDGAALSATGSLSGWVRRPVDGQPSGDMPSTNRMRYASRVQVLHQGGSMRREGTTLAFSACDTLTLILGAGTSYVADAARRFDDGRDPTPRVARQVAEAAARGLDALRAAHERDHRALFDRVALDLGATAADRRTWPTDRRLAAFTVDGQDPELEALHFQFGRYLLIASSRDSLPANLQGLWNDSLTPPWNADYHTNINLQMNYWPAEPANLAELARPLHRFIASQVPMYRRAVRETAALARRGTLPPEITPWGETFVPPPVTFIDERGRVARGWAVRTESNPFGAMGYLWNKTGNAWYARHFWEHFAFTQDRVFLRTVAWPLMKEVCDFWLDHLKALPDGRLVAPHGWSPEHGPVEDGVSYDQQIVWDLFEHTVQAADLLGIEPDFRQRVAAARDRLAAPRVGSWGQLLEWLDEKRDAVLDTPNDKHRHVSHLYALYPGRQITPRRTPALAAAARKTLEARGDAGTGWSMAWKMAFWARLHDGDRARHLWRGLLATPGARAGDRAGQGSETNNAGGTYDNLFDAHPPFQIDGNFGVTAALCEMLLQSHDGEIELLPALPGAWPDGQVRGLRARGALAVDITWHAGRLVQATLAADAAHAAPTPVRVRLGEQVRTLHLRPGQRITLDDRLNTRPA